MSTFPIVAYANDRTGEVVHSQCWGDYVDARRAYDAQGKPLPWGMIGSLYDEPTAKKYLKGKTCAHCNNALAQ